MSEVIAIAALGARTRALGKDGALLFKLSGDLARFRAHTEGHPVIMGRKTWESLPTRMRPLPERTNIVITRNTHYEAEGARIVASIQDALHQAKSAPGSEKIFIIGGGEVYAAALPYTDTLLLTLVHDDAKGDTYFPPYPAFTNEVARESHQDHVPPFEYVTLSRE